MRRVLTCLAVAFVLGATAALAEQPSSRLDDILKRGTLRVGMTGDYAPFSLLDSATGQFRGFDVDMAEALGKALGGPQRKADQRDRLCRRRARGLSDLACACGVHGDLRHLLEPDAVRTALASWRAQYNGAGPVPYWANLAPLHAWDLDVQHVRPARNVGAAGLESRRATPRHDVCGTLWR